MTAWNIDAESAGVGVGAVTLVEGPSFAISATDGDMSAARPHGVFHNDTRIVSRWDLRVDDEPLEPLAAMMHEQPYRATFIARVKRRSGRTEGALLVERERRVGTGLREDITLRNLSGEPVGCTITLTVEADFADLFEVKEGRVRYRGEHSSRVEGTRLLMDRQWRGRRRGVAVQADGATSVTRDLIVFRTVVPERGEWSTTILVHPIVDGEESQTRFPLDRPVEESEPARRFQAWRSSSPIATTDNEMLGSVLQRSQQDLGALRIFDPDDPDRAVVAAGAPWFMTLFGRDSLLTSYMALPLDQSLALGTLRTLANHQGDEENPLTEEQPGRILHEVRMGSTSGLELGDGDIYYGTADATPLFVMLLGELRRWGLASDEVTALLPHADRALEWIERYGDRDGDGFIEYRRETDQGLLNQGWKDSWDGINFADGRLAEAPIALCEVQGYVYGAYLARSHFAWEAGQEEESRKWAARAAGLKQAFNDRFWLPERGYYAVALDRDKRPVDACASNMGHCLWTGIVDEDKAPLVAERLMSPEMFTGWGVRTLATDMGAYNPVSYHNGSVWPHDNAIIAAGLMRYGFVEHVQRIGMGLFEAATRFGGRLPELFCGFDRTDYPEPVPYPTSCSPQAWAAATPIHLIRVLLRFDPWIPHGKLWLSPALPLAFGRLRVQHVPLAGSRLSIDAWDSAVSIEGLPAEVQLIEEPREAMTSRR
ncbi:MAG: amylo-alpha-1,6-glucosidase [Nocardiopsaceae bacterium]|nr:amylo-alpha-1,6-glucosidase [Nocardiopsaceae bacterium]